MQLRQELSLASCGQESSGTRRRAMAGSALGGFDSAFASRVFDDPARLVERDQGKRLPSKLLMWRLREDRPCRSVFVIMHPGGTEGSRLTRRCYIARPIDGAVVSRRRQRSARRYGASAGCAPSWHGGGAEWICSGRRHAARPAPQRHRHAGRVRRGSAVRPVHGLSGCWRRRRVREWTRDGGALKRPCGHGSAGPAACHVSRTAGRM